MAAAASANTSKRRITGTAGRRKPEQQIDLFGDEQPDALVDTPQWQDLPAATQTVLTSLMARLILNHVKSRQAGPAAGAGHDL